MEYQLPESSKFWLAVAGAIVLKLATTRTLSFWGLCVAVSSALLFATFFTRPVLNWWALDPEIYEPATAALLALFGEWGARHVLESRSLADVIRMLRGRR